MKTVFITFSAHTVFRNLFLFPDNFFEQLEKKLIQNSDLRVVFLLRSRDKEKYIHLFAKCPRERCIIETVDVPSKKNFIQTLFRFFYAYLTYTGTTRILTTIGMRPEEPPAAANRLLAPVRFFIANVLGRSKFVKLKVVPYFHTIIFRERPFSEIFERYSPDLVFATHIYGDYDAYILREAKRRGVKTVAMPSGWDHVDKYFLPIHADTLLVPSAQVKSHAVRFQAYSDEEVKVVGYPHFDFLVSNESKMTREEVLKRFNFSSNTRYILYVSGSAYCPDEPDIIEEVLSWIDNGSLPNDVRLVIRPYLGSRSKDKAFDEKKFERLARHPKVFYYDTKSWDTIAESIFFINLMRHASVVMCVYSTVFLEAVVFDRPLVATPFDGHNVRPYRRSIRRFADFEHFKDVLAIGAIKEAHNFKELKESLVNYLADESLDADKRKQMRDEICYKLDGKSSERIVDQIISKLF